MNDRVILSEVREFVKNFTNFSLFSHLVRFKCHPFKGCFPFRKAEILGFFELQDYQKFYKFFFFAFFYDRIQKNHKNCTIKKSQNWEIFIQQIVLLEHCRMTREYCDEDQLRMEEEPYNAHALLRLQFFSDF